MMKMLKNGLSEESIPTSIRLPRIMIAAEKSGGGKTFFTCVLLSLLKERIEAVRAFKCGPDYIREIWTAFLWGRIRCGIFLDGKFWRIRGFRRAGSRSLRA